MSNPERAHRTGAGENGMILPLVLLGGVLLISMAVTFHFVSSSDYKAVGRLMYAVQASALADLASDEVFATIGSVQFGTSDPKTQWVTDLLTQLDTKKGAGVTIDVKHTIDFLDSQAPLTFGAAAKTNGLVEVSSLKATVGPFSVLSGGLTKGHFYREPLFNDAGKDVQAWDLRGAVSVELAVAGSRGPLGFSHRYLRGQHLMITDTTPPAAEFCVFSYMPPPTTDYALNDMQRGGKMTLQPGGPGSGSGSGPSGRVMLRGPIVVLPEDAPAATSGKPYLGGDKPLGTGTGASSLNYPDGQWTSSLALVPGPREALHPQNQGSGLPDSALAGVNMALSDTLYAMDPRRPINEESHSRLKTNPVSFSVTVNTLLSSPCPETWDVAKPLPSLDLDLEGISLSLAHNLDQDTATFQTIDQDVVGYYPPSAYYYCPLVSGQQKFKLSPGFPSLTNPKSFRGIVAPLTGDPKLFTGTVGQEGDGIVAEPVPRADGKPAENVGLVGVYGVSLLESKSFVVAPVKELALWLGQKYIDKMPDKNAKIAGGVVGAVAGAVCGNLPTKGEVALANKDNIADQTLQKLGLDQSLKVLIRRFRVEGKTISTSPPDDLEADGVKTRLEKKEAVVVPYGSYFHEASFWNTQPPPGFKDAMLAKIRTAENTGKTNEEIFNALFKESGSPDLVAAGINWPTGDMPSPLACADARDFLCGEYARKLNRCNPAKNSAQPDAALTALLGEATKVRGAPPLPTEFSKRPQGAFGGPPQPNQTPVPDLVQVKDDFPRGFFPPKFRDWGSIATRSYPDMPSLIAAEKKNNALELKGAVLVRKMKYTDSVSYRGRGIIITVTEENDASDPATLSGAVGPASGSSPSAAGADHLTLVHLVAPKLLEGGKPPALVLGQQFIGSVFSESGVRPQSGTLTINGNLVTGLLNKQAVKAASDELKSIWDPNLLQPPPSGGMVPYWTVEMSGEVTSIEPGP